MLFRSAESPAGTRVTTHVADVSNEAQVVAFRDAVVAAATARLRADVERVLVEDPVLARLLQEVLNRKTDPSTAVERIVASVTSRGVT